VPVSRIAAIVPAVAAVAALIAGITDVVADRRAYEATVALAHGDTERAYAKASDAAALRPDEIRLHLLEAETARRADRSTVEALDAIDDALDVSPRDPVVTVRHLSLLVERAAATLVPEHAQVASEAVAAAVARDPHHARLRLLEGEAARLRGDDAAAEQVWRVAEALAPRAPAAPIALATLFADQRRLAEARAAIDRAALLAPDDPQVAALRRRLDELD
jgi:Flp pilus assembly protein TadD